jgi:hypothetical protein
MPESQGRTLEASRIIAAIEDPIMEMGRNRKGFHSRIVPYPSWIRLHVGNRGLVDQGCSFHPYQDDVLWGYACQVVHVTYCTSAWST